MTYDKVIKTTCKLCQSGCGMIVHMENGKPSSVEGDPDHPINKGLLCVKGKAVLEYIDNPHRLLYPFKRLGDKGEGKWQRISWDEALDTIAAEFMKLKTRYGAETIFLIRGWAKGTADIYTNRFANVFGTPNVGSMGSICYLPRAFAHNFTYGFIPFADYEGLPACILSWGVNPYANLLGDYVGEHKALEHGAKLIVVDPAETESTEKADIWIKPRPGSDLLLALGMIHTIINENLYDKNFIEEWTFGFEELKPHVQDYSPEKIAEKTWVPAELIKDAARTYATHKPACLVSGNGIENNLNNFQTIRALAILRSITGNLGIPGGDIAWSPSGIVSRDNPDLTLRNILPPDVFAQRINAKDKFLPGIQYALPQTIIRAINHSDPYPLRGALIQGANLVLSWSHSTETYSTLKKLEFMVVSDLFMTPTAELADIVLPIGSFLEIDSVAESPLAPLAGATRKMVQVGEVRSDYQVFEGLAQRMGMESYFPPEKEFINWLLKPAGLTFDELNRVGLITGRKQYRTYEQSKFNTPSQKIELYSNKLKDGGFDPLPVFYEPPESPYSEPELANEYPLIFTNRKFSNFIHSGGRQIPSLRKDRPEPRVVINAETAKQQGIEDDDWVYIENKRGRIRQKAILSSHIDPRVVIADYGWWFPEKDASQDVHGWKESNINILTDNKQPYNREMGSATLKGICCKIYKES